MTEQDQDVLLDRKTAKQTKTPSEKTKRRIPALK